MDNPLKPRPKHDVAQIWKTRPACWDQNWIRNPIAKRLLDFLVASAALLALAPILAVVALIIRMTSPGPVFYRGLRTGRYAQPFYIYKFRTMVANADQIGGSTTGRNDSRVTPIGHFLRKHKLDELPQLINVWLGDMSLVGPRPEVYEYTCLFTDREQVILAIRPGITDLSSLHFIDLQSHVGEVDPDRVFREQILPVKNRLRVQYAETQSFLGDLVIILRTVARLVGISPSTSEKSDGQVERTTGEEPISLKFLPKAAQSFPLGPIPELTRSVQALPRVSTGGLKQLGVTRLGFGCWATGGHGWGPVDDPESIRAIRCAFNNGVNHFDTADVYGLGHSEEVLGRALGSDRHQAVIATKYGVNIDSQGRSFKDLSWDHCRRAVEGSLKRLGIERIPLYYAHWPDPQTSISQLMENMLRLREEGKIESIGLSNFSSQQLAEAVRLGPVAAIQIQYSLLEREAFLEIASIAARHNVTIVTWGSLGRGLLTGKFDRNVQFSADDSRSRDPAFHGEQFLRNLDRAELVKQIATEHGVTAAQVALRFVLDTPGVGCSLFGAKTEQQVLDNVGALHWQLSSHQWSLLAEQRDKAA